METYDVFISFKGTDDDGNPTQDAVMAEHLYEVLRERGCNPFFSKCSVDDNGRSDYVTLINDALESAKVFVAVGTSKKNLTSRWVKREINIFSALMMREEEGSRTLLTYRSEDFSVHDLPANLSDLQSYANEKAVVRFIETTVKGAEGFRSDGQKTEMLYPPIAVSNGSIGMGLQIGDVLDGRYELLALVGRGGSSNVYLAVDLRTTRRCAVKEIQKAGSIDSSLLQESFEFEIYLMKQFDHPVIPKLLDLIRVDDYYAIVMEYVEGRSLDTVLKEHGALEEVRVLHIARQIGQALDYLHTLSTPVVYRDMKPANIMLQPDDSVKIVDFGIAREYKEGALSDTTCLGTRGYAAPEQYGGAGQTDGRTDIYALGVTLYQLVTNRSPAEPPYEICPVRQLNPALSRGLEYIIQKCTEIDPEWRFQSAGEFLDALDNIHKLGLYSLLGKRRKPKRKKSPKPVQPKSPSLPTPKSVSEAPKVITIPLPPVPTEKIVRTDWFSPGESPLPEVMVTEEEDGGVELIPAFTAPPFTEMEETAAKLSALDPEAQKIVQQLIDRLSQ